MAERLTGRIRWFSHQKRHGRIRCDGGLPDVFVEAGDFRDPDGVRGLEDGGIVEFSISQTPKGLVAVDVVVLRASQ